MKYKKLISGGVAAAAVVGMLGGFNVLNASATNTDINVEVETILSATFETATTSIAFDENGGFKTGTMTVVVDSNSPTGVIATLQTTATGTNGGALKHTSSSEFIPSITTTVAKSAFPVNHWGWSVDGQTFNPIPSASETGAVFMTTTSNGDKASKTKTIYFGVNVDDTQFEGAYETEILITVLANPAP